MKKRFLSLLLSVSLLISCLSGCAQEQLDQIPDNTTPAASECTLPELPEDPDLPTTLQEALDTAVVLLEGSAWGYVAGVKTAVGNAIPTVIDDTLYIPSSYVTQGLGGEWEYDRQSGSLSVIRGSASFIASVETQAATTDGLSSATSLIIPMGDDVLVSATDYCEALELDLVQMGELILVGDDFSSAAGASNESQALFAGFMAADLSGIADATYTGDADISVVGNLLELVIDPSELPLSTAQNELVAYSGNLYLENLKVEDSVVYERGLHFECTVYNYLGYVYGIAEVYNKDGDLLEAVPIQPYDGMEASFTGYFKDCAVFLRNSKDAIVNKDIDYLSYRTDLNSTRSDLVLDVPQDGYIVISSNYLSSDILTVYDFVHLWVEMYLSCKNFLDLAKIGADFEGVKSALKDYIVKELLKSTETTAGLAAEFRKILSSVSLPKSKWKVSAAINALWSSMGSALSDIDIDARNLLKKAVESVGDSSLKAAMAKAIPGTSSALIAWEVSANISNLVCMTADYLSCSESRSMALVVRGWREAYANYLKQSQESMGHACYYPKGEGRYTLGYITDDSIPELMIIDTFGQTHFYTYEDRQVRRMYLACGSSDIVRFDYKDIYWTGGNEIIISRDGNLSRYVACDSDSIYDFVLHLRTGTSDEGAYFNCYDAAALLGDGAYEYMMNYKNNTISSTVNLFYNRYFGFEGELNLGIREENIYSITPDGIKEALGY